MKKIFWCLAFVAIPAFAQQAAAPDNLSISDLPVVKASQQIYSRLYPGGQEFSGQTPETLNGLENKISALKTVVRADPPLDVNRVVEEARADPHRLQDITQTVYRLSSYHPLAYAAAPLTDTDLDAIARNFFNTLDSFHVFFNEKDIQRFTKGSQKVAIRNAVEGKDLAWVYSVFDFYLQRQKKMLDDAQTMVQNPDNLAKSSPSTWVPRLDNWPSTAKDQRQRWAASVQDDYINARLAGDDAPAAQKKLADNYASVSQDIGKLTDLDKVELFLRSYTEYVDPHSLYLAPRAKNTFSMQINNVLEGIGVVWGKEVDTSSITIKSLVPNGPASRSGQMQVGDQLLKVGNSSGDLVSVEDMRLEDVVDHTRGPAGSKVYFLIKTGSGDPRLVEIKRETIQLTTTHAESKIVKVGGVPTLVIDVPGFYRDGDNPERLGGSVSHDVEQILKENKGQYQAVVLDLRNNGGGVMTEALGLLGLFIDNGVGVQVRTSNGKVEALPIPQNQVQWDGPLVVLVNRRSASASEIAAAAIQDYGRGIVVGENTYGKGSAQTLFDLDQWSKMPTSVYGQINLTTMMFFRPRGPSTQKNGVRPDVWIGSPNPRSEGGENSYTRALPAADVGEKNFVQPILSEQNGQWQGRRVQLQEQSIARWNSQPWYGTWKEVDTYSQKSMKDARSLVYQERQLDFETINREQKQLKEQWSQQGKTLNDGAEDDTVLREALLIALDAYPVLNSTTATQ